MRNRSDKGSSRWQVERERHQIATDQPAAQARDSLEMEPLVTSLLKRLGLDGEQWLMRLQADWPELVGPAVASHTRPGAWERGNVIVLVDSSVWLSELSRFGKPELLRKMARRYGPTSVRSIRFQLDPEGSAAAGRPRR